MVHNGKKEVENPRGKRMGMVRVWGACGGIK